MIKCLHKRVHRTQGPEEVYVLPDLELRYGNSYEGWCPVVWEICLDCHHRTRIHFRREDLHRQREIDPDTFESNFKAQNTIHRYRRLLFPNWE